MGYREKVIESLERDVECTKGFVECTKREVEYAERGLEQYVTSRFLQTAAESFLVVFGVRRRQLEYLLNSVVMYLLSYYI